MASSARSSTGMSTCESAVAQPWPENACRSWYAGLAQAMHQRLRQQRHHARIAREGTVADHAAATVVEVEHRREAEIDAAGAQLGRQHSRPPSWALQAASAAAPVSAPSPSSQSWPKARIGGRVCGAVAGTEALHAAALVIDADQQVAPDSS